MLWMSHANEYGTQHRKDVCLNEGNKKFESIHEYHHEHTDQRERGANDGINLKCNEDDSSQ